MKFLTNIWIWLKFFFFSLIFVIWFLAVCGFYRIFNRSSDNELPSFRAERLYHCMFFADSAERRSQFGGGHRFVEFYLKKRAAGEIDPEIRTNGKDRDQTQQNNDPGENETKSSLVDKIDLWVLD